LWFFHNNFWKSYLFLLNFFFDLRVDIFLKKCHNFNKLIFFSISKKIIFLFLLIFSKNFFEKFFVLSLIFVNLFTDSERSLDEVLKALRRSQNVKK
jgi:hypothetical protein